MKRSKSCLAAKIKNGVILFSKFLFLTEGTYVLLALIMKIAQSGYQGITFTLYHYFYFE